MIQKKKSLIVSANLLKEFLDEKVELYNSISFIETDPIQIPHRYTLKQDIEIAAFFAATIAWGNRKSIITNAGKLMEWMDDSPYNFILHSTLKDRKVFSKFVHRTFNGEDCIYFITALQHVYQQFSSMENLFMISSKNQEVISLKEAIHKFRTEFFSIKHPLRTQKHVSNPMTGSACKRICMFLRWMIRKDRKGVDFGIWKSIPASSLHLPLDVHTGNVGRKLGLLSRNSNDWQAVEEITSHLRNFDPKDPIKYDFALFGLGAFEGF